MDNKTTFNKILASIALLFINVFAWAQTPPSDLNGEALKQWLKTNYYDGKHTELGYTLARQKMYQSIDNDNNTLTGVYSGYQKEWLSSNTSTNPAPINCEHTIPQSFFGQAEPMRSDIHHLFPAYGSWNSERSNHPFADIDDAQTTVWMYLDNSQSGIPSSNIDAYSESNGSVFEPREDHKGNCARAIFYFFTMYPTQVSNISMVGDVNTLYQWHLDDPVDAAEQARNAAIETHQGNRNPYIDHPELVQRAWMTSNAGPQAPTASIQAGESELSISWTNVADETGYKLYRSTDNVNFIVMATLAADELQYTDADVSAGNNYYYYVIAYNDEGNSAWSNVVSAALLSGGGGANELFFSEYVEGSSNDKVLEIANFTGSTISLTGYSIKKQINADPARDWSDELVLSGEIVNGDVYVICNSGAITDIQTKADLSTDSWALSFNGNDPIGLFKNGSLIDIIGTYDGGSSNYFGENVTLIRKPSITGPSTIFSSNDWLQYSQGYIDNLGLHTMDAPTAIDDLQDELDSMLRVYPIPAEDELFIEFMDIDFNQMIQINLIDMTGKVVVSKTEAVASHTKATLSVSHLKQGIYFLRIDIEGNLINRKVIIQ